MSIYYFDTSALVKLYISETGSQWVDQIANARDTSGNRANVIAFVKIGVVETTAAIARRARTGDITQSTQQSLFNDFVNHSEKIYSILTITDDTISLASDLTQRHPLRGYDAVHLAAALELNKHLTANQLPPITFVSVDEKLYQAAAGEGLQTENPNYR